jgi:hypothetical protein
MRRFLRAATALAALVLPAPAAPPDGAAKKVDRDALYKDLTAGLPASGPRAAAARAELAYWHASRVSFVAPAQKRVLTLDGKDCEVVLLAVPAASMPGMGFSMALLVVDKRTVDWVSCWTYNRIARQDLLLEDVDGDGEVDVAFRAKDGWFGLKDERQHTRPGDPRKWLNAYRVTPQGFRSLFPETDRERPVQLAYDSGGQPVTLKVSGIPEKLRDYQTVKCTLTATNSSDKELSLRPDDWFDVVVDDGEVTRLQWKSSAESSFLKPGQSISVDMLLVVAGGGKEMAIRWKYGPTR